MKFDGRNAGSLRNIVKYIKHAIKRQKGYNDMKDEDKDEWMLMELYSSLEGEALLYADSVDLLGLSFTKASDLLVRKYCPRKKRAEVSTLISKCIPKIDEKPSEFMLRVNSIINDCGRKKDDFIYEIYMHLNRVVKYSILEHVSDKVINAFEEDSDEEEEKEKEKGKEKVKEGSGSESGSEDEENNTLSKEEALEELEKQLERRGKMINYSVWVVEPHKSVPMSYDRIVRDTSKLSIGSEPDVRRGREVMRTAKDSNVKVEEHEENNKKPVVPRTSLRCGHCRNMGHDKDTCWSLHPELKPVLRSSKPLN
jgi:hypothetical protein